MRWKRDYIGAIRQTWDWFVSRFKPLTVHTEAIMIDSVWNEIQRKVENKEVLKWYVMTPANFELYKSSFNVKLSKKEISDIMKKRYKWMLEQGAHLELHTHLCLTMKNMSYEEQEKLIKDSLDWLKKELGISVKEFVPGWWSYNADTLKVCKKYGLRMIYTRDYDFTHDYHWIL